MVYWNILWIYIDRRTWSTGTLWDNLNVVLNAFSDIFVNGSKSDLKILVWHLHKYYIICSDKLKNNSVLGLCLKIYTYALFKSQTFGYKKLCYLNFVTCSYNWFQHLLPMLFKTLNCMYVFDWFCSFFQILQICYVNT